MKDIVLKIFEDSITVKKEFIAGNAELIVKGAEMLTACLASGHKILIFGNGGSAADAQHIAAEFVNRFMVERKPLSAIALTTDTSILTCIGNDYDFDDIFDKQIQALGRKYDIAWGISTSGNSKNVLKAMKTARDSGLLTIGFSGRGGKLADMCDIIFKVPSDVTARIQETHITIGHALCDLTDRMMFPDKFNYA